MQHRTELATTCAKFSVKYYLPVQALVSRAVLIT